MNLLWKALIAGLVACFVATGAYASDDYRIFCAGTDTSHTNAPPGTLVSISTSSIFNSDKAVARDLGPGAGLTGVTWGSPNYADPDEDAVGLRHGRDFSGESLGIPYTESLDRIYYQTYSNDALNALDDPPPNPFKTVATVTFSNDDGKTGECDIEFETTWHIYPDEPEQPEQQPVKINPPDPIPVLQRDTALAPAGITVSAFPEYFFTDVGTNMRFVSAHFQSKAYYDADKSGLVGGILEVTAKSAEDLEAMGDYTPPNPFWITVRLKVTNDEGFSTEGTVTYETSW